MAVSRFTNSSIQSGLPKYDNAWDGNTATSAYDSLGSVYLTSAQSSISFSNIPQTYTHLQIRYTAMTARATYGYDAMTFRVGNSNTIDTSANYSWHVLRSAGTSATAGGGGDTMWYLDWGFGTTVSSYPSVGVIDILDYTNTNKAKTMRGIYGVDVNGTIASIGGSVNLVSGAWFKSGLPAINTISFTSYNSNNIAAGTLFTLYGVK